MNLQLPGKRWLIIPLMLLLPFTAAAQEGNPIFDDGNFQFSYPPDWTATGIGVGQAMLSSANGEAAVLFQVVSPANPLLGIDLDLNTAAAMDVGLFYANTLIDSTSLNITALEEFQFKGFPAADIQGNDAFMDFRIVVANVEPATFMVYFAYTPPGTMENYINAITDVLASLAYGTASVEPAATEEVAASDPSTAEIASESTGNEIAPPILNPDMLYYVTYLQNDSSNQILNVVNLATGEVSLMMQNVIVEGGNARSPDGSRLVISTATGSSTQSLNVLDVNCLSLPESCQGNLQQLIDGFGAYDDIVWSPDSTQIAFIAGNSIANDSGTTLVGDLYTVATACEGGCNPIRITPTDTAAERHPDWSPDSTQLTFSSDYGGNNRVYTVNADGSSMVALTAETEIAAYPAWSPDGNSIAFLYSSDGVETFLNVMKPTGEDPQTVVQLEQPFSPASWLDSSENLLVQEGTNDFPGMGDMMLVGITGFPMTNLTSDVSRVALSIQGDISWSPNGNLIAVTGITRTNDAQESVEVYVINIETGIISSRFSGFAPVFSPDGSQVAYFGNPSGEIRLDFEDAALLETLAQNPLPQDLSLYVANLDGSDSRWIAPAFSPVGMHISDLQIFWGVQTN